MSQQSSRHFLWTLLATAILMIAPAGSAVADQSVHLLVVNYRPKPVKVTITAPQGSTPPRSVDVASDGHIGTTVRVGSQLAFESDGKKFRPHVVKSRPAKLKVQFGQAPPQSSAGRPLPQEVRATLINLTPASVDVYRSKTKKGFPRLSYSPTKDQRAEARQAEEKIASLAALGDARSRQTVTVPGGIPLRFRYHGELFQADVLPVKAEVEVKIQGVLRTIHNYTDHRLGVLRVGPKGEHLQLLKALSARRRVARPLLVQPRQHLRFWQRGEALGSDYVVGHSPTAHLFINQGGLQAVKIGRVAVAETPTRSADAAWNEWVNQDVGSSDPPKQREPLTANSELFSHVLPNSEVVMRGYNLYKMDPRELRWLPPGMDPDALIFKKLEPGDTNYRISTTGRSKALLPNYLVVRTATGTLAKKSRFVYSHEAEHANAWSAAVGVAAKGVTGSASFNHVSRRGSGRSSIQTQELQLHAIAWVMLNKRGIQFSPRFIRAIRQLSNKDAQQSDFERFFDAWGTHYPLATLLGGIQRWNSETRSKSAVLETRTGWDASVGFKGVKVGGSNTQANTNSTSSESGFEKQQLIGTLSNSQEDAAPIHVILAPIHELLWSELFPGERELTKESLQSLKKAMAKALARYASSRAAPEQPRTRVFEVRVQCVCDKVEDAGDAFESSSQAWLEYVNTRGAREPLPGFPLKVLSKPGGGETKDIVEGGVVVDKTVHIIARTAGALEHHRIFARFDINERDDSTDSDELILSVPTEAAADARRKGLTLRDAVQLRKAEERAAAMARSGRAAEIAMLNVALNERIRLASEAGLSSYAEALRDVQALQARCQHSVTETHNTLAKLTFTLSVRDVSFKNKPIDFPKAPLKNPSPSSGSRPVVRSGR